MCKAMRQFKDLRTTDICAETEQRRQSSTWGAALQAAASDGFAAIESCKLRGAHGRLQAAGNAPGQFSNTPMAALQ